MPTYNRRRFVPDAIENFLLQTYKDRELVVVDDGSDPVADLMPDDPRIRYVRLDRHVPIGAKRNLACQQVKGAIIVHWDDDDWSAPSRVETLVRLLHDTGADLCGQRQLLFYDRDAARGWRYRYPEGGRPWVAGGTLAFRRETWERHPFPDVPQGEDTSFVWSCHGLRLETLDREDLYVATIHRANTSAKRTSGRRWSPVSVESLRTILGEAAPRYIAPAAPRRKSLASVTGTSTAPGASPVRPSGGGTGPDVGQMPTVTVSIPHNGSGDLLRAAVESVLAQTYRDLVCVVVLDGDRSGLAAISDLDDARLVRHVLPERRGRYFADQVVLTATTSPFFLVQDSDDRSDPTRLARLVDELDTTGADVCLSDAMSHDIRRRGIPPTRERWPRLLDPIGPRLVHRAGHQGLYRTEFLRRIGGWYAGSTIGYDTMILNLALMVQGRVVNVPEPLYHRTLRHGSLSTSPHTGWGSPERRASVARLQELHRRAYAQTRGRTPDDAARAVRRLVTAMCEPGTAQQVEREAQALAPSLAAAVVPAPRRMPARHSEMNVQRRLPDVAQILERFGSTNTGWAISRLGAIELDARLSRRPPAHVLDVGSGLSTVVAAVAAARRGGRVVSLEHDPVYAARTRAMLAAAGVADMVDLVVAPLVERHFAGGVGPWYDGQPAGTFDFFVVDGPPLGCGGRIAVLPAIAAHRRKDWELWLFDADRADEQACLAAWGRRFRFASSIERIDETGVAVLRPAGVAYAAGVPVVEGLGISLLAGGRPRLLARTMASFAGRWPEQVKASYVCAFVNGHDDESVRLLEEAGWVDRLLTNTGSVLPVGAATSVVAAAVSARSEVGTVLHLEDDWEARTLDTAALARSRALLEDPAIGQVRLRHRADRCLSRHMVTASHLDWTTQDGHLLAEAHFTFNPSLLSAELVDRVFPAASEADAQRRFHAMGLQVAQLSPGVFTHAGDHESRRLELERKGRRRSG
ncbi:glycosyltransferase family 2 protein [Humibacillus xanthopallidus]|nr:glycosyltransferase [Humibacillus xanthopallidus]